MTSVNKTIHVSSVQLNKTLSVHCIVYPSPNTKSLVPVYIPLSLWLSPHCCLCLCVYTSTSLSIHTYIFFAQSLHLVFTQLPYPPSFWELSVCSLYLCLFLFYLLSCSLDFTHNWDHMVFVFLQLAYFTQHNILQVNSCCHKGSDFLLFSWEKKSV